MASDDDSNPVPTDETDDLISSDKVEGTTVYSRQGQKLGTIKNFMVGKRDGRVRYAVLSFGGLFGLGERYHPLPWDVLTYDLNLEGFVVNLDKDQLKESPSFEEGQQPTYDRAYDQRINDYFGSNI